MAKCLRCGAKNEWIQGRSSPDPVATETIAAAQKVLRDYVRHTGPHVSRDLRVTASKAIIALGLEARRR